jgi:hypothetical protein
MIWKSLPELFEPAYRFEQVPTGYDKLDEFLEGGLRSSSVTVCTSPPLVWRIAMHQASLEPGSVSIITLNEHDTPEGIAESISLMICGDDDSYELINTFVRGQVDQCKFKAILVDSHEDAHLMIKRTAWADKPPRLFVVSDPFDGNVATRSLAALDLEIASHSTSSSILWSRQGPESPNDPDTFDFVYGSVSSRIAETVIFASNARREQADNPPVAHVLKRGSEEWEEVSLLAKPYKSATEDE